MMGERAVAAWLDRFTVLSHSGMVSKKDLGISYNAAAEAAGRPLMSPKAFCAAVRRLRPTVEDAQRGPRGNVKDVFLGLAMKEAVESVSDLQRASRAARVALEALEVLMETLEWPEDDELNRALSACRQIEECAS